MRRRQPGDAEQSDSLATTIEVTILGLISFAGVAAFLWGLIR